MLNKPPQKIYLEFYPFKNMILIKNQTASCLQINDTTLETKETLVSELGLEMQNFSIRHEVDALYGVIRLID